MLMAWFKGIWQRIKRVNSISTPLGGVGWDNPQPDTQQSPPADQAVSVPEFSASFVFGHSQSGKGRNADELSCVWTGRLQLTNVSPHDAFKITVDVGPDIDIERPPAILRSGKSTTLEVRCCRYFDRREIHPSRYQLPSPEPQPRDIDPLRERCPMEFTELELVLVYRNADGRQFEQHMQREKGKPDMKADQPSERDK